MPYICSLCPDDKPATFLITPLNGGDTMPVGDECAGIALTGLLSSYYQVDAEKLYDTIVAMHDAARTQPAPEAAPPGVVYHSGTGKQHSVYDIDRGLCGYIHDTGEHCHSKQRHRGSHSKAQIDDAEAGAIISDLIEPITNPDGGA